MTASQGDDPRHQCAHCRSVGHAGQCCRVRPIGSCRFATATISKFQITDCTCLRTNSPVTAVRAAVRRPRAYAGDAGRHADGSRRNPHAVVERGDDLLRRDGSRSREGRQLVGGPVGLASWDAAAGQNDAEAVWPMIAAAGSVKRGVRPAVLRANDHGFVEETATVQILKQRRQSVIRGRQKVGPRPREMVAMAVKSLASISLSWRTQFTWTRRTPASTRRRATRTDWPRRAARTGRGRRPVPATGANFGRRVAAGCSFLPAEILKRERISIRPQAAAFHSCLAFRSREFAGLTGAGSHRRSFQQAEEFLEEQRVIKPSAGRDEVSVDDHGAIDVGRARLRGVERHIWRSL